MSAPRPSFVTVLRRLEATRAEVAGLALLACGALLAIALLWWLQRPLPAGPAPATAAVDASEDPGGLGLSSGDVIVHVAGAVRVPGVYTLAGGSRVADAVAEAGGPTRRAVLDGLNLARVLTDGEQVLVPLRGTGAAPGGPDPSTAGGAASPAQKVNLNQATAADLDTLPGIGPVLAERIIQHRDAVGGFNEVGELRDVSGIGEKTFQAIADLVVL